MDVHTYCPRRHYQLIPSFWNLQCPSVKSLDTPLAGLANSTLSCGLPRPMEERIIIQADLPWKQNGRVHGVFHNLIRAAMHRVALLSFPHHLCLCTLSVSMSSPRSPYSSIPLRVYAFIVAPPEAPRKPPPFPQQHELWGPKSMSYYLRVERGPARITVSAMSS